MNERDAQLREELVGLAGRQKAPTRRGTRTFLASVAAFAIAGAITGGTVAAVASSERGDDGVELVSVRVMGAQLIGQHTPLVGEPVEAIRTGESDIAMGPVPAGANSIAFALHCTTVGTVSFAINGVAMGANHCVDDSDTEPGYGMFGTFITPDPDADNTITISVDGSGGYSFWAAWVTRPGPFEPSAEQTDALADGIVDEAEYRAGLNRYIACMAEAGFTIDVLETGEPIVRYVVPGEAVTDGADERCYVSEFRDLDIAWQVSQPRAE